MEFKPFTFLNRDYRLVGLFNLAPKPLQNCIEHVHTEMYGDRWQLNEFRRNQTYWEKTGIYSDILKQNFIKQMVFLKKSNRHWKKDKHYLNRRYVIFHHFNHEKIGSEIKLTKRMLQNYSCISLKHMMYKKYKYRSCVRFRWEDIRGGQGKLKHILYELGPSGLSRRDPHWGGPGTRCSRAGSRAIRAMVYLGGEHQSPRGGCLWWREKYVLGWWTS